MTVSEAIDLLNAAASDLQILRLRCETAEEPLPKLSWSDRDTLERIVKQIEAWLGERK